MASKSFHHRDGELYQAIQQSKTIDKEAAIKTRDCHGDYMLYFLGSTLDEFASNCARKEISVSHLSFSSVAGLFCQSILSFVGTKAAWSSEVSPFIQS